MTSSRRAPAPEPGLNLEGCLRNGQPVGLQLDSFHLDYFKVPFHFAGHCVAVWGMDESQVLLIDTEPQGTHCRVSRQSLEAARFATGPMSARARAWTIGPVGRMPALSAAVRHAVRANATTYLNPPFKGASCHGIHKLAASLPRWLQLAREPVRDLPQMAMVMERAGTGGAIFRNIYRDFLAEARELLPRAKVPLTQALSYFAQAADEWTAIAGLIDAAGRKADESLLHEAARRCLHIARIETSAMQILQRLP